MSEKTITNILRLAYEKKVRVDLRTDSHVLFTGYISDIGDDYVKVKWSLEKKCGDTFIKLDKIESVNTEWSEK